MSESPEPALKIAAGKMMLTLVAPAVDASIDRKGSTAHDRPHRARRAGGSGTLQPAP